jgi:hypothetical protein
VLERVSGVDVVVWEWVRRNEDDGGIREELI